VREGGGGRRRTREKDDIGALLCEGEGGTEAGWREGVEGRGRAGEHQRRREGEGGRGKGGGREE